MAELSVLLVAFHYSPEISAGVQRALIFEEFLASQGHRVTLLTHHPVTAGRHGGKVLRVPLPSYLNTSAKVDRRIASRQSGSCHPERSEGSAGNSEEILRCAQDDRRENPYVILRSILRNWAKRWVFIPDVYLPWAWKAAREAVRQCRLAPFDLVITSSPPESTHWIGWRLQRRCACPWLADFRDGWTLEPHREEIGLPIRRLLERRLERAVVDRADWVTVNARPVAEDMLTRHPARRDRIHVLPTGFADGRFEPLGQEPNVFRLVYTGRFGLSWHTAEPTPLFDGLRLALEADAEFASHFRLVLKGTFTEAEQALWSAGPLAGVVQQLDAGPYEEAMRLASGATALLLFPPRGLHSVIPRKLFDYLAVRRPIFAVTEENEVTRMLRETAAGVWASPSAPSAVAEELLRLFRLWQAGRLDDEIPCSGNDQYRADRHFGRVLGEIVLAQIARVGKR